MELKEFVRLDPNQVRRDKELMQLFVNFYEAAFSFIPKCVGCAFKSGFKKLKKYANTSEKNIIFDKTITKMEAKTFVLKNQFKLKILTYKKDGVIHRKYGHALTEDFAKELVKAGKTDIFAKLPKDLDSTEITVSEEVLKKFKEENKDKEYKVINFNEDNIIDENLGVKYVNMNHREELLPLYTEVKERTGKKALSNKKSDIIAFLIENES